jgi:hypothetical protein
MAAPGLGLCGKAKFSMARRDWPGRDCGRIAVRQA